VSTGNGHARRKPGAARPCLRVSQRGCSMVRDGTLFYGHNQQPYAHAYYGTRVFRRLWGSFRP
jgi:hypothetical protein